MYVHAPVVALRCASTTALSCGVTTACMCARRPSLVQRPRNVFRAAAYSGGCREVVARPRDNLALSLTARQPRLLGGGALVLASSEMRGDMEFVLAALEQNWQALADASEELRGDRACMLAAVKQNFQAFYLAGEELRGQIMTLKV